MPAAPRRQDEAPGQGAGAALASAPGSPPTALQSVFPSERLCLPPRVRAAGVPPASGRPQVSPRIRRYDTGSACTRPPLRAGSRLCGPRRAPGGPSRLQRGPQPREGMKAEPDNVDASRQGGDLSSSSQTSEQQSPQLAAAAQVLVQQVGARLGLRLSNRLPGRPRPLSQRDS